VAATVTGVTELGHHRADHGPYIAAVRRVIELRGIRVTSVKTSTPHAGTVHPDLVAVGTSELEFTANADQTALRALAGSAMVTQRRAKRFASASSQRI